jgi:hypothetical protein
MTDLDWLPIIFSLLWCGLHLAVCLTAKPRSERRIFLFHASSFFALAAVLIVWAALASFGLLITLGALCLHGIYSLSFLELWSLSQGSYSLGILDSIARVGYTDRPSLMMQMAQIGTNKKTDRIGALYTLGLVNIKGKQASLSARGRLSAAAIGTLRALAGIKDAG